MACNVAKGLIYTQKKLSQNKTKYAWYQKY